MKPCMKPYVAFAVCALVAAFGAWLLVNSHGSVERDVAPWLLVVFGLGAIVVPLVLVLTDKTGRGD